MVEQKSKDLSALARSEGNSLFKRSLRHNRAEHLKILFFYSKSIAYAPNDSEELALGYSNRSFLLNHLKMHQQAITDIDRALQITESDVLRAKLMCRKISCMITVNKIVPLPVINETKKAIEIIGVDLKMQSQLQNEFQKAFNQKAEYCRTPSEKADLPSIEFDEELPSTSTAIQMKYSKKCGRHYRATKNISTGEILIIEQGYAAVPTIDKLYAVCSFCLNIAWTGIPCNNCPCVFYCSEQCKNAAWESYHDLECPILTSVFKEIFFLSDALLALKVFFKGLKEDSDGSLNYLLGQFLSAKSSKDRRYRGFEDKIFSSRNIRSIFSLTSYFGLTQYRHSPLEKLLSVLNARFEKVFYSSKFYLDLQNFNIYNFEDFFINIIWIMKLNSRPYAFDHSCFCGPINVHAKDCFGHLGVIIGACSSLINHSCVPSVKKTFKDGKIILFATRPILKNEQIFESYGPNYMVPIPSRLHHLSTYFHFTCDCIACKERWSVPEIDFTLKHFSIGLQFELELFLEGDQVIENARNGNLLCKADMEKLLDKLKFKINTIHQTNSLMDIVAGTGVCEFFIPQIYELYYGPNLYIPMDS